MATALVEVKEEVGGLRPGQSMSGTELSGIREAVATTSIRTAVVTITVTVVGAAVGVVVAVKVIAMQAEVITTVITATATTAAATPTMGKGGTGTAQGAAAVLVISTTRRLIKILANRRKEINAARHCMVTINVLEDAICTDTQ